MTTRTLSVPALVPRWLRKTAAPLSSLADAALVSRAQADEPAAFAELVRRHQANVRGLILRLSRGDAALADDLAQDAFLRAYKALPAFEGRAQFSTWMYRIAYNAFLSHQSRTKPTVRAPEEGDLALMSRANEDGVRRSEMRRDLRGAIAELPEAYRNVVELYYIAGRSYPEIAEQLDIPLGTVKTHLHRAKRELRGQLESWKGGDWGEA